jgi:ubiquitin C-terminal hydrolase
VDQGGDEFDMVGMENPMHNCYINAVIQAIFAVPGFK